MKKILFLLITLTSGMHNAFAISSKETHICIKNDDKVSHILKVAGVDNEQWDGSSRPDWNFDNIPISPGSVWCQREEVKANVVVSFTFLVDSKWSTSMVLGNNNDYIWKATASGSVKGVGDPYEDNGAYYSKGENCSAGENCYLFHIVDEHPSGPFEDTCHYLNYGTTRTVQFLGGYKHLVGKCKNLKNQEIDVDLAVEKFCANNNDISNINGLLNCGTYKDKYKVPEGPYKETCTNISYAPGDMLDQLNAQCKTNVGEIKDSTLRGYKMICEENSGVKNEDGELKCINPRS